MGWAHPDHLAAQLTASQLAEWRAYASIEPFGEWRQELRHGQTMHLLDSAHFKRTEPLKPIDFMNFVERPEEKEATQEENFARIDKEVFGLA